MLSRLRSRFPALLSAAFLLAGAASAAPSAALGLLSALGLLLGLGAAGLSLSLGVLPDLAALSRWASALVLAAALVVIPATVLGHFGLLAPRPFLGLEALLIVTLSFLPGPTPARPGAAAPEAGERRAVWIERAELILLVVAGLAAAVSLVSFAVHREPYAPPIKLDDPSYHLPAVAVWNRFHDLRMIKLDSGDRSTAFYPIGGELIDWALLAPLRESDFLARWGQLPFALGSLIALAAIARRLELSRRSAFLAVLLYLTVDRAFPVLAFSAGNDHVTSFYTLATADAILLFGGARTLGAAAYLGLTFGLLLGVKYVGLLIALPLLALLAAAGWPRGGLRAGVRELALFSACAFAAGGYTYLRNAWIAGNPVFPAPVAFLGLALPGWREVTLAVRRHLPEFQIDAGQFLLFRTGYFGPLFRFTMLPAAVLSPLVSLFQKGGWRERIVRALLLSLPVIFFLQFLYQIHDHRDIRYFFAAVALAAVAFAWLIQRAVGIWPWLPPLVGSCVAVLVAHEFILTDEATRVEELTSAWGLLLIAGVSVTAWPFLRERLAGRRNLLAVLGCGLAVIAAVRLAGPLEKYQDEKYQLDPVARYLDERSGREGLTLAYTGGNRPYALFGSRLRNRVEIVPRSGPVEDRFYTWGGTARFPFGPGTYRQWRENLHRLGVQYVVLETGEDQAPARPWMRRHPRDFERVFAFGDLEVWRLAPLAGSQPRE